MRETDIRPADLMQEQTKRYMRDVAKLMAGAARFDQVRCPACENVSFRDAFCKYGMQFVSCANCEMVYANPRPNPEQMAEYYQTSENYAYWNETIFPASEAVRREQIFKPRAQLTLDICERYGVPLNTLVEIGAGFGIFCEEMKTSFRNVLALEPTPGLADTCRKRGITTIGLPIEKVNFPGLADVVAAFEVIEHLYSPREFVYQCKNLLVPGGILILTCPNAKGFDILTLQEQSGAVDTEHVNLFNLEALALLMKSCGMEVLEQSTPGQLDADIVRNQFLNGKYKPDKFMETVLLDKPAAFQQFLIANQLSGNQMMVARKP